MLRRHARFAAFTRCHAQAIRLAATLRCRTRRPGAQRQPATACELVVPADGGMPVRTSCAQTSPVSEPNELRQPCEAPLRRHGPSVGGPCWQCRCSRPSRALPSGQLDRRRSTRANRRPRSWIACSTLLTQQGRAACRSAARREVMGYRKRLRRRSVPDPC